MAALLTPPGRGAVATVAVRGPHALGIVSPAFRSASGLELAAARLGAVLFGTFTSLVGASEELVVCRAADEVVEIHCHGGKAAAEAILKTLQAAGATPVTAEEWLAAWEPDPVVAEAQLALAKARTERTAAILLDQYRGALRREIEGIVKDLDANSSSSQRIPASRLQALLARARLGLHLTNPFSIVLAGQPNVGKSSLINALCGYERAIVSPQAGTTRDVVTASTAISGWPVELADTAGLREAAGELEQAGIERAKRQLARADLVLLIVDATRGWSADDERLLAQHPAALVVYNKCDLASPSVPDIGRAVCLSALTGQGLPLLEKAIAERLQLDSIAAGDAVPFTARQTGLLEQALNAHPAEARQKLLDVLGDSSTGTHPR